MKAQGLSNLPVELVQHIAAHFTRQEHASVRATCKWLDAALLESWGKMYASSMQVMRLDFSLQALVDISKSRLSPFLKHVVISMEELPGSRGCDSYKLNTMSGEQRRFMQAGEDLKMLEEAFCNLQLEAVEIHSYYRFEPQATWTTYGWRKVMDDLDLDLSKEKPPLNFDKTLAHMIPGILSVLGKGRANPVKFEVNLASGSLTDESFMIPSQLKEPIMLALSQLESLSLPVRFANVAPGTRHLPSENPNDSTYNFRRFLRHLEGSKLRRLKLDVPSAASPETEAFFQWLGASPGTSMPSRHLLNAGAGTSRLRAVPPPVSFQSLEQLELVNLCISRESLTFVLRKFQPTLRSLRLRKVCLEDPRSSGTRHSTGFGDEVWTVFLWSLVSMGCGDTLKYLALQQVAYSRGASTKEILFPHKKKGLSTSYEYSGTNMCGALEALAGQLYPHDDFNVFE